MPFGFSVIAPVCGRLMTVMFLPLVISVIAFMLFEKFF